MSASSSASSSSTGSLPALTMTASGLSEPFASHTLALTVPLREDSPHIHLVFAIDTSGSMGDLFETVMTFATTLCERSPAARYTCISWSGKGHSRRTSSTTEMPECYPFWGGTDFCEAFNSLAHTIDASQTDVVYIFLTDGKHAGRDPIGETLVSRTLLAESIQRARERGISVTGHALVLTYDADVAISHTLVTPGGHLACRGARDSFDDLLELFGSGQTVFSDVSVILGGQEVWEQQIVLEADESGQLSATVDVFLPPGLREIGDCVVEVDGQRQVVEISPCGFSLDLVTEFWQDIRQMDARQQIETMLTVLRQFDDWTALARREFSDIERLILSSQTLSQQTRFDQVAGILTRLSQLEDFATKLTLGGVVFALRPKGDLWDAPRKHISDEFATLKAAASQLLASVRAVISDLETGASRGYRLQNAVLQRHATQAYAKSTDVKRSARRAKLRLRKLAKACEKIERFELAMQILRSEGRIPDDHAASEVWQCLVSFDCASEAPGGLILEVQRPDAAFDDPTALWVKSVGGFISFEVFFRMVQNALDQGRSDGQAFFGADGIGTIGGVLPLALFDKHWDATFVGFYEQAIGMTVAGDAFGFKTFMAPVLYGKALQAIWDGTRSEVSVHRILAVVDTIRRIPAPAGGFALALEDFAAHRFADETGARLEALAFFAAATFADRDTLLSFLGLVLSETIRRATRFSDELQRADDALCISRRLCQDPTKAILADEKTASAFFYEQALLGLGSVQSASSSDALEWSDEIPLPILSAIAMVRSALDVYDAIQGVDFAELRYEYGLSDEGTCRRVYTAWTSQDDRLDVLDWVAETFGVDRYAVFWPWLQPDSSSTSQARTLGDKLATIYSASEEAFLEVARRTEIRLARRAVSMGRIIRMMLETEELTAFAGFVMRYVTSADPLAQPTVGVIQAYREEDRDPSWFLPLWKLRVLFKGQAAYSGDPSDPFFTIRMSNAHPNYFRFGKRIVPSRQQRKRIKFVYESGTSPHRSKQSWRRLFNIRKGVPTESS